jgi:hypothetical protein
VAPDVIESPTRGPGTTRKGGRSSGGVPEQGGRTVQTHDRGAADGTGVVRITSVNVPERMNELSDGVIRPFNATTEGPSGSILEIPGQGDLRGRGRARWAVECCPVAARDPRCFERAARARTRRLISTSGARRPIRRGRARPAVRLSAFSPEDARVRGRRLRPVPSLTPPAPAAQYRDPVDQSCLRPPAALGRATVEKGGSMSTTASASPLAPRYSTRRGTCWLRSG